MLKSKAGVSCSFQQTLNTIVQNEGENIFINLFTTKNTLSYIPRTYDVFLNSGNYLPMIYWH